MWDRILPYRFLIGIGFVFLVGLVSGIEGYTIGKGKVQKDFDLYRSKVEILSLKQERQVNDVIDAQRKIQIGAADDYIKRIDDIRKYYRLRKPTNICGNEVSSIPGTTGESKSTSPYDILAGQCAETTQQVISLQKSWEEQKKLYNEGMQ